MVSVHYELEKKEYEKLSFGVRLSHDLREIKTKNSIFEDKNEVYARGGRYKNAELSSVGFASNSQKKYLP